MSVTVTCDHCNKPVVDVAWVVRALDAQHIDNARPIYIFHLHWECLRKFGRSESRRRPQKS